MGYGKRAHIHGEITTFEPDDTASDMYLRGSQSFTEILTACTKKWPGIKSDEITINPEYIQTDCIGYDAHDGVDWEYFLHITCSNTYLERATTPAE